MARYDWIGPGVFGLTVLMITIAATPTAAQSLGTFRWQTQPFCNVLVLNVTVSGGAYRLEGTDDQCGGTPASAIGMAYPKADGTIGVGLTLVFSSAVALHVDGTIVPGAGFSGSWSDSVGRSGTLLLTPGASLGGPVRPVVAPAGVRGAFVWTTPASGTCTTIDHPLTNGDPNAMLFVATRDTEAILRLVYNFPSQRWTICIPLESIEFFAVGDRVNVLVVKQ